MTERSIINGSLSVALAPLIEFAEPLRWVFIAAIVLVFVDLRFGIAAAKYRGERIRPSRAIRRTVNKIVDYVLWIMLAGVIGEAFGEPFAIPLLPLVMLLVIFGCEINSCYSNYFEAHGKKIKINVFKFFARKTDIIEPEETDNNQTFTDKK